MSFFVDIDALVAGGAVVKVAKSAGKPKAVIAWASETSAKLIAVGDRTGLTYAAFETKRQGSRFVAEWRENHDGLRLAVQVIEVASKPVAVRLTVESDTAADRAVFLKKLGESRAKAKDRANKAKADRAALLVPAAT